MSTDNLTLRDVYLARQRIAGLTQRTPLVHSPHLSEVSSVPVYLKLENAQRTGSFKTRGAANKLLGLSEDEKARGVITISSGNHGRAVGYVSAQEGIKAIVCLTSRVPDVKVDAIVQLGAEVVVAGDSQDEAELKALQLQKEHGYTFVHPFDDPHVIAGQGTIGLELVEDLPQIDTVLVPMSGGGLIAGIGLALKTASSNIRVIGVTMEHGAAMYESLRAGKMVDIVEEDTLADALAGGLGSANNYTLRMCQQYVDEAVLVSEDEIGEAIVYALDKHHVVLEGGAAVGIAALLHNKVKFGGTVAVVLTGGNVDVSHLMDIVRNYTT